MSSVDLARMAYEETALLMRDPEMSAVVEHGLSVLYGPPIQSPSLALVTFQGGGASPIVQRAWPERLLYLDDPFKFGSALRGLCAEVGLDDVLQNSTVAIPVVFPQAPSAQAGKWMARTGPRRRWRDFSVAWVNQLLAAMQPKVVMVFGEKASETLGIEWQNVAREHAQNHMTYGEGEFVGQQAVYCHHLSQGYSRSEALRCFGRASRVISGGMD